MFPALGLWLVLLASPVGAQGGTETISAAEGYERIVRSGTLEPGASGHLTVIDAFLLDKAAASLNRGAARQLVFRNVTFAGGVRAAESDIAVPVRFEHCRTPFIRARSVRWLGPVELAQNPGLGRAVFEGGSFEGTLRIGNSTFEAAYFKGVDFRGPFELLNSRVRESSFSGSKFHKEATFDWTDFGDISKFYATEFGEVSFREIEGSSLFFQNVTFRGDAVFALCRVKEADFGRHWPSAFCGRADFSGSTFDVAAFDRTDFQQSTTFGGAQFGDGGASFKGTHFADNDVNFEGVSFGGPLALGAQSASALRFIWPEIEAAVERAEASPEVLDALAVRSALLGHETDARKIRLLAELRRQGEPLVDLRRAAVRAKYFLWDDRTAYGAQPWGYILVLGCCAAIGAFLFSRRRIWRRRHTSPAPIFISYRRAASSAEAQLIHEGLDRLGMRAFMDLDDVVLGPFPDQLAKAVAEATVMLVVISPDWADAKRPDGKRRLEDPEDWVRREISLALEKEALLVPVLVRDAALPPADAVPEELRPLLRFQAVSLRSSAWTRDFAHLVELLSQQGGCSGVGMGSQAKPVPTPLARG